MNQNARRTRRKMTPLARARSQIAFLLSSLLLAFIVARPAHALSSDPCRFPGAGPTSWDPAGTMNRSFDPAWVSAIRQSPAVFAQLVGAPGASNTQCLNALSMFLKANNSSLCGSLAPDGLKLIVATAFSYESASYGSSRAAGSASNLLNNSYVSQSGDYLLSCSQYVSLAIRLYYWIYQASGMSPPAGIKIHTVGWRSDPTTPNPVGNHAQFFVTGVGPNMLLDPTANVIASTTLKNHLNGTLVSPNQVVNGISLRSIASSIPSFPATVVGSLTSTNGGHYQGGKFLMYSLLTAFASDPTEAQWVVDAGTPAFVDTVVPGPSGDYYYKTGAGVLWQVDSTGITLAGPGVAAIAAGPGPSSVFQLTKAGALWQRTPSGWVLAAGSGVAQIASGQGGAAIYELTSDGRLYVLTTTASWTQVRTGVKAIATGMNGQGLYVVYSSGLFSIVSSSGETVASYSGIVGVTSLRQGEFVAYWSSNGLYLHSTIGGAFGPINSQLSKLLVGVGQQTLDVLQTDGRVCTGNPVGNPTGSPPQYFLSSGINLGSTFSPCVSPPNNIGGSVYSSIQLINDGVYLQATPAGGGNAIIGQATSF
ncbi:MULTISPECIES: hypothetical protein [unclassified Bradyrhizobium]|uniref:hypothetical protein n=1 Tax=unclassified Bradyrhizobium TaxID=2631580 RepID=UPI001BA4A691|nr:MULTISPECIES: hypothetical protein [unclassified Bradyrhizobium]MBR1203919.1 hypothetical protein [Bradyrhizobium sp. AUGA SZCCT0124]MBR1310195.1 hypothetical protein [Bradyrhizobium sp. AUGA SZCCT0051]MBR1340336.1 hypothetical protein [Bradyrhizobium sp. AUGA SZCCT0105]MBR1354943.1 hypothetical protein [Bradyrhizobium sp. AUGA SZCCT0045]